MKWIGTQTIYDNIRLSGNATNIAVGSDGTGTLSLTAGDITMFNPVTNGDPGFTIGKDANECLIIKADYASGTQNMQIAAFKTKTESGTAHDGRFHFIVDETRILKIQDDGINLDENMGLIINDTDIITDSSGTATLSNIDAGDITLNNLVIAHNANDYATFAVADTGDLTISTTGDGARDSDLILDADGQIKLEPVAGESILLDGTIAIDAGVVTGATSITSTAFVGALTGQADTVATIAGLAPNTATTQATQAAITSCANLATVGTIGTGVWQGTAVASAYLDADTMHYSAQKQITHHSFSDDIDTTKHYIGFTGGDQEAEATTGTMVPLLAPVGGKLLKIFLRSNKNLQSLTFTWRLETQAGVNFGTGPSVVGTQSGVGCQNSTMTTYDFTTGLDSGDNLIDAGDMVYISIQSSGTTAATKFYITCLWEWDLS